MDRSDKVINVGFICILDTHHKYTNGNLFVIYRNLYDSPDGLGCTRYYIPRWFLYTDAEV